LIFVLLSGESETWLGAEVSRIHEGGNAAMIVSLLPHNALQFHIQIPDQVIVFDPSVQVNNFTLFIAPII